MSNPTELPGLDVLLANYSTATINYSKHGDIRSYYNDLVGAENAIRELIARRAQPEGEAPQADGLTRYSMWSNPVGHGMDPSPSGDWVSFDEVRDLLAAQYQGARCSTCDGTGMVHRADGEYLGECGCEDAASAPAATLSPLCGAQHAESGKEEMVDRIRKLEAIVLGACEDLGALHNAFGFDPADPIDTDRMICWVSDWRAQQVQSRAPRLSETKVWEAVKRHAQSWTIFNYAEFDREGLDAFAIELMDSQRAAQLEGGQEESESNG